MKTPVSRSEAQALGELPPPEHFDFEFLPSTAQRNGVGKNLTRDSALVLERQGDVFICNIDPKSATQLRASLVDRLDDRVDVESSNCVAIFESRLLSAGDTTTSQLNIPRSQLSPLPDASYRLATGVDPHDLAEGDALTITCEVTSAENLDLVFSAADPFRGVSPSIVRLHARIVFQLAPGAEGRREPAGIAASPLLTSPLRLGNQTVPLPGAVATGVSDDEEEEESEGGRTPGELEGGYASDSEPEGILSPEDEMVNHDVAFGRGVESVPNSPPPRYKGGMKGGGGYSPLPGARLRSVGSPAAATILRGGSGSPRAVRYGQQPQRLGAFGEEDSEEEELGAVGGVGRPGARAFEAAAAVKSQQGEDSGRRAEGDLEISEEPASLEEPRVREEIEESTEATVSPFDLSPSFGHLGRPAVVMGSAVAALITAVLMAVWFGELWKIVRGNGLPSEI